MTLGEKISALRKNRGLSQEMLAEHAKVSLRTIQRIESGETSPRPYTLGTIAAALNSSIGDLEITPVQADADFHPLKTINLLALTVIIIPGLHLLVMIFVWRYFNRKHQIHAAARRIVSFQILWTIITPIVAFSVHSIQKAVVHSVAIGQLPPTLILVYALMLLINLYIVILAAIRLQRNPESIYGSVPALF